MHAGFRATLVTGALAAVSAAGLPALAQTTDAASAEELKAALAEIKDLRARLSALESRLGADPVVQVISAAKPSPGAVEVKLKPAPSMTTADGQTSFAIDGRVLADAGWALDDGAADIGDDTDLRHLWFGFSGKFDGDWRYKLQTSIDNNQVGVKDAFIAFDGIRNVPIMVGNFYENNGVELMSGNLTTTFMEPSSGIGAFRTQRYLGVSVDPHGENWGAQIGLFGDQVADPATTADDEGYAFASRVTFAPVMSKTQLLHLGGAVRRRTPDAPGDTVRFRSAGESHVIGETLVDTGNITAVDHYDTLSLEGIYRIGGLTVMSEYNTTEVARSTGAEPTFDGGYVSLGYFLTGEQREYNAKRGVMGRLKPKSAFDLGGEGMGAFEVAARYNRLDLTDGPVSGGEMDSYTLGLNWYPNAWSRLMFNYVVNERDGTGPAIYRDIEPKYLMLRVQADF
jgi:phosphate-selective porin OprO/OprP